MKIQNTHKVTFMLKDPLLLDIFYLKYDLIETNDNITKMIIFHIMKYDLKGH